MIVIKNSTGEIIKTIPGDTKKTLLKQLNESGVEISSACFTGICGACMCRVESGRDNIIDNFRGEAGFPLAPEEIMTCISGIKDENSEVVLQTIY
ncbi:2Fe-2S iron-sulfur cluster binding domain-containing protein [Candidatus Gracilibacteria bacterium 28_42_T64]|nr:2Fe-2S iron-sulfur cluster binding domain-containing protein [Candidatus Gracilibacteria bacterium 28_42_T64]